MSLVWNTAPQGTEEWKAARRGAITGSRAKDARDFNAPTAADKKAGIERGKSSAKREAYAMDLARQRCGGTVLDAYTSPEMRIGTEREADGRMFYEDRTGNLVELAGFVHTEDCKFGCSVDGLIGEPGIFENKVMVSSATLFRAVVDGDISEFIDQCLFELWLLRRQWVDLVLYVYDMPELSMVIRIERNEEEIQQLEDDMLAFERLVTSYETKLRARLSGAPTSPPWTEQPSAPPVAKHDPTTALAAPAF